MNSTSDTYRMNPAEDMLLRGDQLADGMWVLAELDGLRQPRGISEDDLLRRQRFRRVSGLRGGAFTGTWVDGYQETHSAPPDRRWIVKKAAADAEAVAEAEVIARICASGYNEHVRLHGPDGDRAGAAAGGSFTIARGGRAYTVTVTPAEGEARS